MAQVDGSNLIKDGDQLTTYHYQITEFIILINGEKDELPLERIYSFKIENYFEKAVFPIFKLNIAIEPSRYFKMIKNKKDVKFKVRIQMYYTTNDEPEEKSMLRDYINDTFVFFPEEDNSNFLEDNVPEERKDDLNDLENLDNYIELFLFKDIITGLRSPCNYIFTDIDMCTTVTYLLYKTGVSKMLMSPFENTQTYEQLVVPPQSVEANIRYLNNNFGFHRKGSVLFFGFFHNYLLNANGECTAYEKKEWKESIIYVLSKANTKTTIDGAFVRPGEEKFYTLIQADAITVENTNVSSNVISGVNPTAIDMKNNSTSSSSAGATEISKENNSIVFVDSSNDFLSSTIAAQYKAGDTVITAMVDNVNIEAFNPNKKFSIIFENSEHNGKYGGTYRIANSFFTFEHSAGDFIVHALLTFKKMG